jgi:hypothetical protein
VPPFTPTPEQERYADYLVERVAQRVNGIINKERHASLHFFWNQLIKGIHLLTPKIRKALTQQKAA